MFTKGKSPDTAPANANATAKPAAAATDIRRPAAAAGSRAAPSLISADVKMKGSFESAGEVQIDGQIEGDVKATALTIGDSGAVMGEVVAETVIVRGKVKGSIRGKAVQLCKGASVEGDITHASLAIEPNAVFQGQVRHAQDPMAESTAPTPSAPGSTQVS